MVAVASRTRCLSGCV